MESGKMNSKNESKCSDDAKGITQNSLQANKKSFTDNTDKNKTFI